MAAHETETHPAPETLREQLRDMWSSVAPAWEQNAAYVDTRGAAVTSRMLELTTPHPGERVLELACGVGGPGFAAAALVGPGGDVVVSDVAPEMTAVAAERAARLGLGNVDARVLDLERIDEADDTFDVVLCREGLMLVPDPARAAGEIRRVARQDGRVAVSVWGPRDRNPWLGIVFDVAAEALGMPVPPPGTPHPFSLDDADRLAALLRGAGLVAVAVEEVPTPYRATSVDEWWQRTAALAGPLARRLGALPDEDARALRTRAAEAARAYETSDGLEMPGVCLVATARA
jgi:ubiquinone/menaquinone biosynthesis C-methylase UbiE